MLLKRKLTVTLNIVEAKEIRGVDANLKSDILQIIYLGKQRGNFNWQ
jgi:hypothetical protein